MEVNVWAHVIDMQRQDNGSHKDATEWSQTDLATRARRARDAERDGRRGYLRKASRVRRGVRSRAAQHRLRLGVLYPVSLYRWDKSLQQYYCNAYNQWWLFMRQRPRQNGRWSVNLDVSLGCTSLLLLSPGSTSFSVSAATGHVAPQMRKTQALSRQGSSSGFHSWHLLNQSSMFPYMLWDVMMLGLCF